MIFTVLCFIFFTRKHPGEKSVRAGIALFCIALLSGAALTGLVIAGMLSLGLQQTGEWREVARYEVREADIDTEIRGSFTFGTGTVRSELVYRLTYLHTKGGRVETEVIPVADVQRVESVGSEFLYVTHKYTPSESLYNWFALPTTETLRHTLYVPKGYELQST